MLTWLEGSQFQFHQVPGTSGHIGTVTLTNHGEMKCLDSVR